MATDITLWQMLQETRTQKTDPPKDYISALWSEYKREKSDKVLGHLVGEIPPQTEIQQRGMRRMSMADKAEAQSTSRHGSIDASTDSDAMAKASAAIHHVPPPAVSSSVAEQPRRNSWWKRSPSASAKDMESFIHMAFSG